MELRDDDTCSPIQTLEELADYTIPVWSNLIIPLQEANWCSPIKNKHCHEKIEKWIPPVRMYRNTVPRTLVCHDMQGGYLEDKYVHGSASDSSYNFYHWSVIDIFVYFSHHFITIPPFGWINAAHKHGVSILGTIITEGEQGKTTISRIVEKEETIRTFVNSILYITENYNLDGWLLNIENEVDDTEKLKSMIKLLVDDLHEQNSKSIVIWYDSVTANGELKWQNELNDQNKCWFDLCDAIYLNYSWNEANLTKTLKNCEHRPLDVYVGVDIFGRNCTGGMECNKPLELIRKYGLSVALFAPGWTYETLLEDPKITFRKRFEARDLEFWKRLSPYLYEHAVYNKTFGTTFHSGHSKGFFNLNSQDIPINSLLLGAPKIEENEIKEEKAAREERTTKEKLETQDDHENCDCLTLVENNFIANGSGLKVSNVHLNETEKLIHRILVCDVLCDVSLLIGIVYQHLDNPVSIELWALIQEANGRYIKLNLSEYETTIDHSEMLALLKKSFDLSAKSLGKTWILECFKIKKPDSRVLEIGIRMNEKSKILIGGLTVQNYPLKRTIK